MKKLKLPEKLKLPKIRLDRLYIFSFLMPVLIMLDIFFIRDIYPFGAGDRSFLHIDMYHQYFPFLVEFYHKLRGGESLFYSWNTGIGSNFYALYVYYLASPFNWLCVLFPEGLLMEFLTYLMVVKIGLCGVSFTYYIRKHFGMDSLNILLFSIFYSLSGFMAAYNWDVMWLDVVALAPIVILGLERLVAEGNGRFYCAALALSIISNYYLSIMLCIFLVLYFIVLLIGKGHCSLRFYMSAALRFCIYSLLAGGMAAVLLLPELAALQYTEFSEINFPDTVKTYFSVIDMLARHFFNVGVETGLDHFPNVYCGTAVLLLLPLYIMQKNIPVREKAPKLLLLAFMLISCSVNLLNFLWHGFNYPDSLPARHSFLYIFLMLALCYEAFLHIREHSNGELLSLLMGAVFFVVLCEKLITDDAFSYSSFIVTGIFILIYAGCIHSYRLSGGVSVINRLAVIAFTAVIAEAGINTYLTSCPTVSRDTYLSNYDSYKILTKRTVDSEENSFFRFEKFARRTQNDAMLIGFQGGSYFSSTLNSLVADFYEKYGMRASRVNYCYDGATPVTAAILSNKYMLYTLDRGYDNLFELSDTEGKLYLYRNNYYVPFGFAISDTYVTNDFGDALNPIQRQNIFVNRLGIDGDVFIPVETDSYGDIADLYAPAAAHYYAYTDNGKIEKITVEYEDSSKTFSNVDKKYILDLGYLDSGELITIEADNGEALNLDVYSVNEPVLKEYIDLLRQQTMTVDSYDETSISGSITVDAPKKLVLSVPYEKGWHLKVDGAETDAELFEDTFICVELSEGTHTISLSYYPEGFNLGAVISIFCVLTYLVLCLKNGKKHTL